MYLCSWYHLALNISMAKVGYIFKAAGYDGFDTDVEWMKQYGETIYGTRGGVVAPHDWGVTTQKGNRLYVHILNLQDKALFLPLADKKVKKAVLFKNGTPVRFSKNKAGVLLEFAEIPKDIDYVVELTID